MISLWLYDKNGWHSSYDKIIIWLWLFENSDKNGRMKTSGTRPARHVRWMKFSDLEGDFSLIKRLVPGSNYPGI